MEAEATSASGPRVTGAIRQAAQRTGADFQYLLATAQAESNFNPSAAAPTSSAGGLFQFIEQTWLSTVKQAGAAFGYGQYANAITQSASGHYVVADGRMYSAIMQLRNDPTANSVMAGIFTRQNGAKLAAGIGRIPDEAELYIAHFLGAAGAAKLIEAAGASPGAPAAGLFPSAARANPAIFYDQRGAAHSVSQVYSLLVGKYQAARASAPPTAPPTAADPLPAATPSADAAATPSAAPAAADDGPVFHTLFRTGERREPIAPLVSRLWAPQLQPASPPAPSAASAAVAASGTGADAALGLFATQSRDMGALFGAGSPPER